MTRIIVALLAATVTAAEQAEAPNSWHLQGGPRPSQGVRFANGDAQLVGTVYLPNMVTIFPTLSRCMAPSLP
jgi:hypothetical protein